MNEDDIRHLSRKEQLEWLIPFLEQQIQVYQEELDAARAELKEINILKKERR